MCQIHCCCYCCCCCHCYCCCLFYRAVVEVLIAHPKLTEHTVDVLEAIEQATDDR